MNSTTHVVQDHFAKSAEKYANAQIHAHGEDLQWLVDAHPLTGQECLLDVGTGTGHVALKFAPHVASVEGIDITRAMLEQAEKAATEKGITNATFSLANVEALPHPDHSFDIVVSRWCAHHYPHIRTAVQEITRVLKPEGVFLLVDSYAPTLRRVDNFVNTLEMLRDTGHVRNYSLEEWTQYLAESGWTAEVLKTWMLRLDGDNWVERIHTPAEYVTAIQKLLRDADSDLSEAVNITGADHPQGWGFDLPTVMLKAIKQR